jgi:oligopeptide/dipeptide ABC transporter ATP-binding protein
MALLELREVSVAFDGVRVVDEVSFSVGAGEMVCLVGESGSGKTVTALAVARLLPSPPASYTGNILLEGEDVLKLREDRVRAIRGKDVAYVFQEPAATLNPVMTVGRQIRESLELHRPENATDAEVIGLLRLVGIPAPESRMRDFPFQMSGGMQQRVMISMALASEPRLLIADEPTTALDVTVQAQILDLLTELQSRLGMAMLFISHNLGIVRELADRVVVMYAGQVVEIGAAKQLLSNPLHPYTRALIQSVPSLGHSAERLNAIPGSVPAPRDFPTGCRFFPRCPTRRPECATMMPELREAGEGRLVRCAYVGKSVTGHPE